MARATKPQNMIYYELKNLHDYLKLMHNLTGVLLFR